MPRNLNRLNPATLCIIATLALSGCRVISAAGSVVGAAVDVTSAVVTTTVKVTGKVIEKGVDAVTPSKDPTK